MNDTLSDLQAKSKSFGPEKILLKHWAEFCLEKKTLPELSFFSG